MWVATPDEARSPRIKPCGASHSVLHSLEYTAYTFLGYPIGSLLSLPLVERIDRKWLIVISAFLMAVFGISFGVTENPTLIILFGSFVHTGQ
jgi:putative MFS transporter